jgi:hypothetical protein
MKKYFFLIGMFIFFARAQDSLPWKGTIVFDDWVRVDDAPGTSGHPAYYPQTIMDDNHTLP